jgi:hypothetical protein
VLPQHLLHGFELLRLEGRLVGTKMELSGYSYGGRVVFLRLPTGQNQIRPCRVESN